MDDAFLMCNRQRVGQPDGDVEPRLTAKPSGGSARSRLPFDQLHRQEMHVATRARLLPRCTVTCRDGRARRGLSLALESRDALGIAATSGRTFSATYVEPGVGGAIDFAHSLRRFWNGSDGRVSGQSRLADSTPLTTALAFSSRSDDAARRQR
jgi:hypothetical protein